MKNYFPGSKRRRILWNSNKHACWICGRNWGLQTHHIERRSHCYPKYADVECNFFRTCDDCHDTKLASMPHADQLAIKLEKDCYWHSLEKWLHCKFGPKLREGGENRVTTEDVGAATVRLFGKDKGEN